MTLQEWEIVSGKKINKHESGALWIPDSSLPIRFMLWNLEDYRVSSVSGGTIWLTRRNKND